MKTSLIALALAALATTGVAQAADAPANAAGQATTAQAPAAPSWSVSQTATPQKTRAEVRHELAEAERDGEMARLSKLYQGG